MRKELRESQASVSLSLPRSFSLSLSLRYFCFVKNTHTQGMSSTERPDDQQKALFRFPRPPFSPKKYRVSLKYIHNKIFSLSLSLLDGLLQHIQELGEKPKH